MAANERSEEQTVDRDDYQLTFYPGFCSRVTVRIEDAKAESIEIENEPRTCPPHC